MSLKDKYLFMYDVRGIQNYIFRTHRIKEIIGASKMVEDLIIDLFRKSIKDYGIDVPKPFKQDPDEKLKSINEDVVAEIVYYGGGNLYVIYQDEDTGNQVSKKMCMKLIKDTYSLQLAVASVKITGDNSYKEDYDQLRKKMEAVKLQMPTSLPVQGFPITLQDPVSGFPFSELADGKMITYESKKKLEKYNEQKNGEQANINDFGTEDRSLIAIVHIDGNNMSQTVRKAIQGISSYSEATKALRKVSNQIQNAFVNKALVEGIENKVEDYCEEAGLNKTKDEAYRRIIAAGDDITFITNAKIAMKCVEEFMNQLEGTTFTACAGIYICHSHFPFARGYEYAEELCGNAKKLSRKEAGNYVDFQLNTSGILNSIEVVRNTQYVDYTGTFEDASLIQRPYAFTGNSYDDNNIKLLKDQLQVVYRLSRNKIKQVRDAYYYGEAYVYEALAKIDSRLSDEKKIMGDSKDELPLKALFDAIDIMDLGWWSTDGKEE